MIDLRPYQKEAVAAALSTDNGLLVLPTGSGKSLVIAGIVNSLSGKTVIFQPNKEILEQNYAKIQHFGFEDATVFSASLGIKEVGKATFATIGSVMNQLHLFYGVETVVIDEAHLVNAKGGQYLEFIQAIGPKKIIGLTATPYRLHTNSFGSQIKILTRTRPKVFRDIIHVTQTQELVENGFLHQPEFYNIGIGSQHRNMLGINSSGSNFTESSVKRFLEFIGATDKIITCIEEGINNGAQHLLVFTESLSDKEVVLRKLTAQGITAATVSGETPKKERTQLLNDFKSGKIQVMINVGVLTTGFDFPELDCLVIGRPTMSLSLWYQMVGRAVRPHPDKKCVLIYDVCGNYKTFGNPLEMRLEKTAGRLWDIYDPKGRRLTTRFLDAEPEDSDVMQFGKFKGKKLSEVPDDYLKWAVENFTQRALVAKFQIELNRRVATGEKI